MNNTQRSLLLGERNGHGDDLDSLLRRFFRSEMPKNWPAPPRVAEPPRTQPRRPARSWYRWTSRLALAAAVSFFLIGYLTLANLFPSGERRNGEPLKPLISHKDRPLPLQIDKTRSGRPVGSSGFWKDGKIILNVKELGK